MQHPDRPESGESAVSKSLLIVMALTVVGKVSGFVREMFMSNKYGLTPVADAIKTALDVPGYFLTAIVGALAATLIAAYSSRRKHGQDQADRFVNNLLTIGSLFSIAVMLLMFVFIGPLVNGFFLRGGDPATREMTIALSRLMMPLCLFTFLSRVAAAYLQANFRFTLPALTQILYNIILIGAILFAAETDATYVAVGAVAGWFLQFVALVPSIRRTTRFRPECSRSSTSA